MHSYDYRPWNTDTSAEKQISSYGKYTSSINKSSQATGTETLSKGQVIRAEIIDLRGQEVKLQWNNSDVISARISSDVALSIGEEAIFQVEDINSSSLSLKVITDDRQLSQDVLIDKALENANLPKTARSISIVNELLKYQMSIDKGTIQNLLKQAATFRNASIETLVIMNKYNIELNDVNTTQFEAYRNYEHRLLQGFSSLADAGLDGALNASPEAAREFHELLLTFATDAADSFEGMESGAETSKVLPNESMQADSVLPEDPSLQSGSSVQGNLPSQSDSVLQGNPLLQPDSALQGNPPVQPDSALQGNPDSSLQVSTNSANLNASDMAEITAPSSSQLSSLLNEDQRLSFYQELPQSLKDTMDKNKLLEGNIDTKELLNTIKNKLPSMDASSVSTLLKSSAYQTVIKEAVMNQWTLTPKMLKGKKNVDAFYQKLTKDLSELEEFLHKANVDSQEHSFDQAEKQTKNLQDNIEFMKSLNQLFSYVQLPMKLSNQNAHSELYVYTNKRALAADSSHISVLLHLDMDHLGPLDIHLDLNKTHVNSKIYTEEDSQSLIHEHMPMLSEALLKKGYSFSYELHKREHSVDIVRDILKEDETTTGIKRYTFDIRA